MLGNAQLEIEFCENVLRLYESIESWLPDGALALQREEVQIEEEAFGTYSSQKLILNDKGRKIATFLPIGASVIGADGRVDVRGRHDKESLLFLRKEKPENRYFYINPIDLSGWYWIENTLRAKAHPVDETLFRDLLWRISDYEFS